MKNNWSKIAFARFSSWDHKPIGEIGPGYKILKNDLEMIWDNLQLTSYLLG